MSSQCRVRLPWMAGLLSPVTAIAAQAAPVPAGANPGGTSPFVLELLAILLPLGFIIVCLLVLLRVLRRRLGLVGLHAPLSVVQVLPVGPRERIVVVRSRAGRAFALGVSAQSVTLLTPLDAEDLGPLEPPAPVAQGGTRGPMSLLQRLMVKRP